MVCVWALIFCSNLFDVCFWLRFCLFLYMFIFSSLPCTYWSYTFIFAYRFTEFYRWSARIEFSYWRFLIFYCNSISFAWSNDLALLNSFILLIIVYSIKGMRVTLIKTSTYTYSHEFNIMNLARKILDYWLRYFSILSDMMRMKYLGLKDATGRVDYSIESYLNEWAIFPQVISFLRG